MSVFLYFIEGATKNPTNSQALDALGVGYAFGGVPFNTLLEGKNTPSGKPGLFLADVVKLDVPMLDYSKTSQTWIQMRGGDQRIWVGVINDNKPREADLQRKEMLEGYTIKLANGESWQIPLIHHTLGTGERETHLPAHLGFDANGEPKIGNVLDKYQYLIDLVQPYWDAWYLAWSESDGEDFVISCDTIIKDAVATLAVNYFIGLTETELLGLFTNVGQEPAGILNNACDCNTASAFLQKKTSSASQNINSGETENQSDIARPSQTLPLT